MARRDEPNALNYFADTKTTIDKGPDIFVSIGSSLVLTCRVYTAGIRLNYLIWRRGDEVLRRRKGYTLPSDSEDDEMKGPENFVENLLNLSRLKDMRRRRIMPKSVNDSFPKSVHHTD